MLLCIWIIKRERDLPFRLNIPITPFCVCVERYDLVSFLSPLSFHSVCFPICQVTIIISIPFTSSGLLFYNYDFVFLVSGFVYVLYAHPFSSKLFYLLVCFPFCLMIFFFFKSSILLEKRKEENMFVCFFDHKAAGIKK